MGCCSKRASAWCGRDGAKLDEREEREEGTEG
jgi:hypothetical protein